MVTLIQFKWLGVILFVHSVVGFVVLNTPPTALKYGGKTVTIRNVTITSLSPTYLKELDPHMSILTIENSIIQEIDKNAFERFVNLNHINLNNNEIRVKIDPDTFSKPPSLKILDLSNVHLEKVELNLPYIQELKLSSNDIHQLETNSIIGNNLNYLDISSNKIKELKASFKFLPILSTINISSNGINHIDDGVFENNIYLFTIYVNDNKLTTTNGLKLKWVKSLDLSFNSISSLNTESFSQMYSLEYLYLHHNEIQRLGDPFADLLELKYLDLSYNEIEELDPDLFRKNSYLTRLTVNGNKLKSLNRFNGDFPHLKVLELLDNQIINIDEDFFLSTPNLIHLNLNNNGLKMVSSTLAPLNGLIVLGLANNGISSVDLSKNTELTRIDLSNNNLKNGLSLFKNNLKLIHVDLHKNEISNFCDADSKLNNLVKIMLRENKIENLDCLKDKNFKSLCQVDLRSNPLICDENFDDLILNFARKGFSSHNEEIEGIDSYHYQCGAQTLDATFALWNSIKGKLCNGSPTLEEIYGKSRVELKNTKTEFEGDVSKESDVEIVDDSPKESDPEFTGEISKQSDPESVDSTPEHYEIVEERVAQNVKPREGIIPQPLNNRNTLVQGLVKDPQSARVSWEQIDQDPNVVNDLEEQENYAREGHYNWYTIALVLIGLSLALTCFNVLVFLYIRLKVSLKADKSGPQKYTFLHNEVYKNTTEPTKESKVGDTDWVLEYKNKNKIFSYGKFNEFLHNFGKNKNGNDAESTKNILTTSNASVNVQNC